MMPITNILLGICLAVPMSIWSTQQEELEPFLTWNITDTTDSQSTQVYFTRDFFNEFYGCLCKTAAKSCQMSTHSDKFLRFAGKTELSNGPVSASTKYECSHNIANKSVSCSKLDISSEYCPDNKNCISYNVNETLLNTTCDLPLFKLLPTHDIIIAPIFHMQKLVTSICAPGCSNETQPPNPTNGISPITTDSLPSSSPNPSSGLTNEQIIIIGLAAGLVIVIAALITFGVILWKRRQKSRDHFLSKDTTACAFKNNNDDGIVNYGGDYASADDIIHPYSTSNRSTDPAFATKGMTNQYSTIDSEPELRSLTKASVKPKNGSSIKVADSTMKAIPSFSENPYSEPETESTPYASSAPDARTEEGNIEKASGKKEDGEGPDSGESTMQDSQSAVNNHYSKPETNNIIEAYAVINPNAKLKKAKHAGNMDEAGCDTPTGDVKVLYHAPSFKYGNSNLNVNSSPDSGCVPTKDVDMGIPGSSKLYYASTDIVNSDFNTDQPKPQDTHEYFILERNYESSDSNESEDV